MDQCQNARSPAKARPAARKGFHSERSGGERSLRHDASTIQSAGTAIATRQNAEAVGCRSDTRTQIGESAMHVAPASRATSAIVAPCCFARMPGW